MLSKKFYMSICIIAIIFFIGTTAQVDAKAPNVIDCLEKNAECEDADPSSSKEIKKDQVESVTNDDEKDSGSLLFSVVKMFFALLLVLALIYLLIKFLSKRSKLFHQVNVLENLGGISVGQNKSIQLVRIGSKVYLVGVGENVEMLEEITDDEVKNDLLDKEENHSNEFSASNLLPSFLQAKAGENNSSNKQNKNDFKHLFSRELENLKNNRKDIINRHKQKEDKHE